MLERIFKFTQGKSTGFFVAFFVTGTGMHIAHRLDSTFITFMTALLGFVVGHSYKDDKHEQAMAGTNGTSPPAAPGPPEGYQPPK
jgi:hypothetical protein